MPSHQARHSGQSKGLSRLAPKYLLTLNGIPVCINTSDRHALPTINNRLFILLDFLLNDFTCVINGIVNACYWDTQTGRDFP